MKFFEKKLLVLAFISLTTISVYADDLANMKYILALPGLEKDLQSVTLIGKSLAPISNGITDTVNSKYSVLGKVCNEIIQVSEVCNLKDMNCTVRKILGRNKVCKPSKMPVEHQAVLGKGSVPGNGGSNEGSVPGNGGSNEGSVPGNSGSNQGSVPGSKGGGATNWINGL